MHTTGRHSLTKIWRQWCFAERGTRSCALEYIRVAFLPWPPIVSLRMNSSARDDLNCTGVVSQAGRAGGCLGWQNALVTLSQGGL